MDNDLERMGREQLIEVVLKLRDGVRKHRDSAGHELCWHHPALWGLLPERTDPLPVVPDWPQFLQGCLRYRQSLDEQVPDAPRTQETDQQGMVGLTMPSFQSPFHGDTTMCQPLFLGVSFLAILAQQVLSAEPDKKNERVLRQKTEQFDRDPQWVGQSNRAKFDDYGREGAHQFGFSDTVFAGGKRGELGGLMYSSPSTPGYYGDKVGRLILDDKLTASGKIALTQYGSDGGLYLGWFDSKKRGHPPANILGVEIVGTTSSGPRFRACVASSDPKSAQRQRDTAAPIAPDGASHSWKIEYQPDADGGRGRVTVWLDDRQDAFTLPSELRRTGATFDRFGLFVHEGGGRASRVFLDDLQYTAGKP